ncbi:MAG TPA: TetR/AcrR family transcriptional regulator [Solirubrobacteraceae bacterium]
MRTTPTRAERRQATRRDLLDAAEKLFNERGFAATSLDVLADAAGYTKGAVYSNFDCKEDVFFSVYERRVERFLADVERAAAESQDGARTADEVMAGVIARREGGDGWLAVFLEFWTHVLRHPEHRERFAEIHVRVIDSAAARIRQFAADRQIELPIDARQLAIGTFALGNGLGLERLTAPDIVEPDLALQMQRLLRASLLAQTEGGS